MSEKITISDTCAYGLIALIEAFYQKRPDLYEAGFKKPEEQEKAARNEA